MKNERGGITPTLADIAGPLRELLGFFMMHAHIDDRRVIYSRRMFDEAMKAHWQLTQLMIDNKVDLV